MKNFFAVFAIAGFFPLLFGATEGFETPSGTYTVLSYIGGKLQPHAKELSHERSTLKAFSGKYSLELNSSQSDAVQHFRFLGNRPAASGGIQLKFRYFIAEGEGKFGINGRIQQFDQQGKLIKPNHFFGSSAVKGSWQLVEQTIFPKPECAKFEVRIWLAGKMRVYLDDVSLELQKTEEKSAERAQILMENSDGVWFAAPADRKIRCQGVPERQTKDHVLKFSGAKGEKNAVLLVFSPKKKFQKLELRFSDPALFSVSVLDFIEMKNPDNPAMKGFHSDPLLAQSFTSGIPGRNSCFYVELQIPYNAPAGSQQGFATLLGDENELGKIPYELKIRSFALPRHPFFKTYMPIRATNPFCFGNKRPASLLKQDMLELCSKERINPIGGLDPDPPNFEIRNGKVIVRDWSRFDHAIAQLVGKYDFDSVRLPLSMFGHSHGWFQKDPQFMGEPLLKGIGLDYLCQVVKLYTEHLKEKFPGVTGYVFLYDEPPSYLVKDVKRLTDAVYKAAPDCKIYMTGGNGQEFIHSVAAFCAPMSPGYVWNQEVRNQLKSTQEMWYYNWDAPLSSHDYQRNRLFPWLAYSADGCGGLAWHSNDAGPADKPVNPWTEMDKTFRCGIVSLFYPPRNAAEKVSASVRLRIRGKSLEDYDYLKLLEKAIDRQFPGKGRARVKEMLTEIIPVPPFQWLNDPDRISALHERIGDEIEACALAPKALLCSNPAENSSCILPEIRLTLWTEPGAKITTPDNRTFTADSRGQVCFTQVLPRIGENKLIFKVEKDGFVKQMFRQFTLLPDPNLLELKKYAVSAEDHSLVAKAEKSVYTEALKTEISARLKTIKSNRLKQSLSEAKKLSSVLSQALVRQAEKCIQWQLPERADYYLELACDAASASSHSVQVIPFLEQEHFGVELNNGILSARFLETGGRLISFRVRGIETFSRPEWKGVLSPRDRALRQPAPELRRNLPEYGGMEDASGDNDRWIVSAIDWKMELIELSENKAVIGFSTAISGTPFRIRRAATLEKNSNTLQFDYTIFNTTPPEMKSEDPASFLFPWRLRLLPGIGADGAAHDQLEVPSQTALKATMLKGEGQAFFSSLFRLTRPAVGAYDAQEKCGFVLSGTPQEFQFAYCWFDDCVRAPKPLYTLEILRSFLLTASGIKDGNKPFSIEPGREHNFRVFLRGISGTRQEWMKNF